MKQCELIKITLITVLNHYAQSLICYDCYDTGPSNEKCIKTRNCTGEACLLYEGANTALTTAFCLLNLPEQYRKRVKVSSGLNAQCWFESDGKGKHCICSENFCNKLRNRQLLSEEDAKLPLINATMVERNPLIDYENNDSETILTFDLENLDGNEDAIAIDAIRDLVPIGIENYDYEDELKLQVPVKRPPPPPPILLPTQQPFATFHQHHQHHTTVQTASEDRSNHETVKSISATKELPTVISGISVVFPDQMLQAIEQNQTFSKLASNNYWSFRNLVLLSFFNLFLRI